ncbi:MMPL family transporter [Georgenia sp. Z1344]|uniref:MMPL family transporter n=1 Tax=Georgenia sp. Z1344 TaxID=3416706 RepID=UPI003CF66E76
MAGWLFGVGRFAARHAKAVLGAWLAVLILAGGAFAAFAGTLTGSFDMPDTASSEVIAELEEELPDQSGATGTVVLRSEDGAFTEEQISAVADLGAEIEQQDDVAAVVDPFATQEQLAGSAAELESGAAEVESGQAELDAGRTELEDGQALLDEGRAALDEEQTRLDGAREQAEAAGAPTDEIDAGQTLLDEQRAELDAEQERIDDGLAELETGQAELDAGRTQTELGAELLEHSEGIGVVSEDGSTARLTVSFSEPMLELDDASRQAVVDVVESAEIEGVEIVPASDLSQTVPEILGIGEVIGVVIAGIVLVVVLGSALAASFPIVTAVMGVAIGSLATLAFSGVVQMSSVTPVFGVMLGLAVGIDYSLFIINRHRTQLLEGVDVRRSIALANGTAGTAVVFAGATVVLALLALNVVGIPFLGIMGTAGAVSIVVAVLLAVTATPALLSMAGLRMLGRKGRARREAALAESAGGVAVEGPGDTGTTTNDAATSPSSSGRKAVRPMSMGSAVGRVLVGVVALLVLAIPALDMRLGLPTGENEPVDSDAYRAYEIVSEEFGEGANGPLLVTADLPGGLDENELLEAQVEVVREIGSQEAVVAVAPIAVSEDGTLASFQVLPEEDANGESTAELVNDLRALPPVSGEYELGVAGQSAINIDISEGLSDALPGYLAVVVGLSFLIMVAVFRSLLVPLVATAGFVLSLFATYGVATAVFQWGWLAELIGVHTTGPILSFLPVIVVGVLFGLAMDYQLFLTTGMREAYVHGASAREAVAEGFRAGRRVVTAAALIMIAVFAGFITSDSVMIKSFGVGLAVGVALDAFVVRMLIVPASLHILGRSAWWLPRWLDKVVPNVDVEGSALVEEVEHGAAPAGDGDGAVAVAGDMDGDMDGARSGSATGAGGKHVRDAEDGDTRRADARAGRHSAPTTDADASSGP